jgi:hypothetical protein
MIQERLSDLSSTEEIFNSAKSKYEEALRVAGYKENLEYTKVQKNKQSSKQTTRKRKIIWFNPPFNAAVSTNIARAFLNLVEKHFPKNSPLQKYFNKNNIKVSYSCMPNVSSIISSHNSKILGNQETLTEGGCNCRGGMETCPLQGKCLTESMIYKATVTSTDKTAEYIGLSSTTFKSRYNNHTISFRNSNQATSTGLSKFIWKLKEENKPYDVTWKIACLAPTYLTETKKCQLCLCEKTLIVLANKTSSLNKKHEIMGKCRHKNKKLLSAVT